MYLPQLWGVNTAEGLPIVLLCTHMQSAGWLQSLFIVDVFVVFVLDLENGEDSTVGPDSLRQFWRATFHLRLANEMRKNHVVDHLSIPSNARYQQLRGAIQQKPFVLFTWQVNSICKYDQRCGLQGA